MASATAIRGYLRYAPPYVAPHQQRRYVFPLVARGGMLLTVSKTTSDVVSHAVANHGVITRKEALALGITARTLNRRLREGLLVKVAASVYALPGILQAEESTLASAPRILGAVVSHQGAAHLHGVALAGPRLVVSVPHRRTHAFADVVVHQLTDIRPVDMVMIRSLPVTSPARTALDLAAVLSVTQSRASNRSICIERTYHLPGHRSCPQ